MGLVDIHDLDALCHFNGLTHCAWLGKEGQNEGTVFNHLWMVHYRLGLVCNKCNNYLSTSSDTLHCLGLAELSTLRGGRPQQVIFIRGIVSRRQADLTCLNWESEQRNPAELASLGLPYWGHPNPLAQPWRRSRERRCHLPTHNVQLPVFSHILTRQLPPTPELHKTSASSVGLCKLKAQSIQH